MTSTLDAFFRPAGIAIVGATDDRYYPRSLIRNLLAAGFPADAVHPVHPRHETVGGLRCYPDLASVDRPVDLVVVITRNDTVAGIVTEAGRIGAKAALVLADGFAEQGEAGRKLQEELSVTAERAGVVVLGPNTLGFLAPPEGVGAWAAGQLPRPLIPGSVGVVFQSSGMLNLFLTLSLQRRLGIRAAFSTGNELSVDVADLVEHFARDEATRVIAMVLETTTRPRRLVRALELARSVGKPVVMLKLGASERAQRNAVAHTGRMASSAAAWEAMLRRLGVVLVHDHDELIEAAALFDAARPPARTADGGAGAALVTISGGDCSLLADLAERVGLPLADLAPETSDVLARIMEKPDLLGNPLDCENLHQTDPEGFLEAVGTLCRDPGVDVVGFRLNLPERPTERLTTLYRDVTGVARAAGVVPVVLSRASEPFADEWFELFAELGMPFLPAYRPGLSVMARWCGARSEPAGGPGVVLEAVPETVGAPEDGAIASWAATQELLRQAGIPYAPCALVASEQEAADAAGRLPYPLVAKLISPEAPHKSDIGGVITGLRDASEVREAFLRIQRIADEHGLSLEGVELQAMVSGGFEMILGLKVDPVVGPLLLVGVGGVLAEVTHDVVVDVPALDQRSAERLIRRLTSATLFDGYRGRDRLDVPALASMVVSLAEHAARSAGDLVEVDFNPVLVLPEGQGAVAVDALAVVR